MAQLESIEQGDAVWNRPVVLFESFGLMITSPHHKVNVRLLCECILYAFRPCYKRAVTSRCASDMYLHCLLDAIAETQMPHCSAERSKIQIFGWGALMQGLLMLHLCVKTSPALRLPGQALGYCELQ